MRVEQFAMERWQSTYEHAVDYNLSESGVLPLTTRDLLSGPQPGDLQPGNPGGLDALLDQPLGYTQSNGTPELRAAVAAIYPDATEAHVEITNGGSEANYITIWRLIEPGDEVVMLLPNYMQTWGLARAFGAIVRPWPLVEDTAAGRWRVDIDALHQLITPRTRLVVICNPNNPTGACLTAGELDAIAGAADRVGAWVLSDEIYRGAEIAADETPSMWGRSPRVIVTSGLSKAYGLPGLRIGWILAPPGVAASSWAYHDYTTIAPGALSDRLARTALAPGRRQALLGRTRNILRANLPLIEEWLRGHGDQFRWIRPEAGAICYVYYNAPINSTELVTRLLEEQSVLVVPGDHFGMDHYLRIGFGESPEYVAAGLARVHHLLTALASGGTTVPGA